MSLVLNSADNEYVLTNTQPLTIKPISISVWIKSVDDTNNQGIVCLGNGLDEFLLLQLRGGITGDPASALEYATAWKYAESSSGYTANTWHHIAATFVSPTERSIWIDGGSKVINTDEQDVNFTLLDRIYVGTHKVIGGAYFDGQVAEIAIWKEELTDAQILSLASGNVANNIESEHLKGYWKLVNNYLDSTGLTNTLSVGAGTPFFNSTSNPPIFNYPRLGGGSGDSPDMNHIRRLIAAGNNKLYYENV